MTDIETLRLRDQVVAYKKRRQAQLEAIFAALDKLDEQIVDYFGPFDGRTSFEFSDRIDDLRSELAQVTGYDPHAGE
jgi:hypothetical protein